MSAAKVRLPLWEALRQRHEPASVEVLANAISAPVFSIYLRLRSWVELGAVETTRINGRKCWKMSDLARGSRLPPQIDLNGEPTNRQGRTRLWRAMRVLRRFDLATIAMASTTSRASAQSYINCLLRAGLLTRTNRTRGQYGTFSTYVLVNDVGVLAPVIRHRRVSGHLLREVFDPNGGVAFDISPIKNPVQLSSPFFDGVN